MKRQLAVLFVCAGLLGCSFYARSPDSYRAAVRDVLDQKRPEVQECYKRTVESDEAATGRVIAKFDIEPKSGKIVRPEVMSEGTTANEALQQCVLRSLEGLTLDPPDQRKGEAVFVWEFTR